MFSSIHHTIFDNEFLVSFLITPFPIALHRHKNFLLIILEEKTGEKQHNTRELSPTDFQLLQF